MMSYATAGMSPISIESNDDKKARIFQGRAKEGIPGNFVSIAQILESKKMNQSRVTKQSMTDLEFDEIYN